MTAADIVGLVAAGTALVTAVSVLLAQIGHLIYHQRQDGGGGKGPGGAGGAGAG